MAAADTLTFDIVPPRRPSLDDVGDAALVDDAEEPPIPPEMPYADQLNQWALLIQRFGAIVPVAIFSIRFSGSTPILDSFTCLPTAPITSTFTITDNGMGDTTITWPANTFPTAIVKPMAEINGFTPGMRAADYVANGVRVVTLNSAGAAADLPFTVAVF